MEVIGLQFGLLLHIILLLLMISASSWLKIIHVVAAESAANNMSSIVKPGCRERCGNITIPFPFGIGPSRRCFLDEWYEIVCNNATQIPRLKKVGLEVLNIDLPNIRDYIHTVGLMRVKLPIIYDSSSNCSSDASNFQRSGEPMTTDLSGSNFYYSQDKNIFAVVGCFSAAFLNDSKNALVGCKTKCNTGIKLNRSSNYIWRLDYCKNTIPSNLQAFNINFQKPAIIDGNGVTATNNSCSYAALVGSGFDISDNANLVSTRKSGQVQVMLEWGITKPSDVNIHYSHPPNYDYYCQRRDEIIMSTQCYCGWGYDGNAYLVNGCQDIDECQDPGILKNCHGNKCVNRIGDYSCIDGRRTIKLVLICIGAVVGAFILVFLGMWLYRAIKRRKQLKLKQKFFKQNGGLLLQQQLSSPEGNVEKGKLFNSKVLENATDNFSDDRILGQGGQGTVYKGMLMDGTIVAVKKSKLLDEGNVEQFINEVFILSQINHRNVVKILGCCLETEVPLLVYEFIPNGNLYQYLHNPDEEFLVSWEVRMRLATEVAGALAYLHSAASIPIYHRDIKTTNILLDDKYRAKIADFGTSKSVALDQTHVTTLVQGTFGYLDPEYFQSSQFTDKSDVYSFGVVLVVLLTGQKPISALRADEGRSLATYFILAMEANRIFDIIDIQVLNQGKNEEIIVVANLARRCLHLNGRNRPTMKEVAIELEGIVKKPQQIYYNSELQNEPDIETAGIEAMEIEAHDSTFRSAGQNFDEDVSSTWDVSPLLFTDSW